MTLKFDETGSQSARPDLNVTQNTQTSGKMPDLRFPSGAKSFLEASLNDSDWDTRVNAIKAANNGQLPYFWTNLMGNGAGMPDSGANLYMAVRSKWDKKE